MKVGIVIHTSGGHTLEFARAIRAKLEARGHEVDLSGLRTIGTPTPFPVMVGGKFTIKSPPELDGYDTVLVGGPVWSFGPSPVIMRYLSEDVQKLKGKKAMAFVTMGSPDKWAKWCGADRSLRLMGEELEASGADVLDGEKLRYLFKVKPEEMDAAAQRVCEKIGA